MGGSSWKSGARRATRKTKVDIALGVVDSPDDSVTLFLNQCHAFNQTSVTHTVLNQCLQPNFLMHSLVDSMTMVQVSLGDSMTIFQVSLGDSMTIVQENVGKWSG